MGTIPGFYVVGTSWGHPRFPDGGPLFSSSVRVLDLDRNQIHTLNSIYDLEKTKHKLCMLSRCGGDLCCLISPAIQCDICGVTLCLGHKQTHVVNRLEGSKLPNSGYMYCPNKQRAACWSKYYVRPSQGISILRQADRSNP